MHVNCLGTQVGKFNMTRHEIDICKSTFSLSSTCLEYRYKNDLQDVDNEDFLMYLQLHRFFLSAQLPRGQPGKYKLLFTESVS